MRPLRIIRWIITGIGGGIVSISIASWGCDPSHRPTPHQDTHDKIRYVGIDSCRMCHQQVYADYIHTGMGRSFRPARPDLSNARFPSPPIFDSTRHAYYRAFLQKDSIFIEEFRIDPTSGDTFFHRVQRIDYIVGSGQHTNSHIYSVNGYLYQAPLTFYTQDSIWDLPPGFHGGQAMRWERPVGLECMSCHNAMPGFDTESVNRYHAVPLGIDCERCHGPGSRHVERRLASLPFDTGEIVHPGRLPPDRQIDLCQRCHLQGLSILRNGHDFMDFRPGMRLADVWNVYYPRQWLENPLPIMASHPLRMKMSKCYQASRSSNSMPALTCLSCHNPHRSVNRTPREVFIRKCLNCHQRHDCTASLSLRTKNDDDCITCHMPNTATHDIPHVKIHDHFIRIPERSYSYTYPLIKPLVDTQPPLAEQARAILDFVERFSAPLGWLDSIQPVMKQLPPRQYLNLWLDYTYFRRQVDLMIALFLRSQYPEDSLRIFTTYRLGESYEILGNPKQARYYFLQALRRMPKHPPFHLKVGVTWMQERNPKPAIAHFRKAVELDPSYPAAWNNLGFAYLVIGHLDSAQYCIQQALSLSADNPHAWANLLKLHFLQGRMNEYQSLKHWLREAFPNENLFPQVWQALESIPQ